MKLEDTKRKFLSSQPNRQHKRCAQLLRDIYNALLEGRNAEKQLSTYQEIAQWLNLSSLNSQDLKKIADRYHQHLKLAGNQHKEHNLLSSIRRGDRKYGEAPWPISIYFDKIRSAHNVGSMLRTAEAFSLGKAYFSDETPSIGHKQVEDAAMGATQWIECHQGISLETLPRPIIALETSINAISLFNFTFPDSFTLVAGNEEYGCSQQTLLLADFILEIPLRGHKNSLNVANAFAIVAAEIYRQKWSRLCSSSCMR